MDEIAKHGGDIYSYIEINGFDPLDYSANVNPLGLPENVKKALAENIDSYSAYPDVHCRRLKEKVGIYEKFDPDGIVFGNGAADIIYRLCHALRPKTALLTAPTFSEYEQALINTGCKIRYFGLNPENGFAVGTNILDQVPGTNIVFICNPNNPTGSLVGRELIYNLSQKCKEENCIVVIDECFMDFVGEKNKYSFIEYLAEFNNVIIVKAFTKTFAMAGLRLGYCLCRNEEIIYKIKKVGQPWSVSVPAQVAGVAAIEDSDYLSRTVQLVDKERGYLTKGLSNFGFTVFKSHTNFILFKTEHKDLYNKLYKKGVLIRKCLDFNGLDETYYRIAVRSKEDNEKLIGLIREVIDDG